MSSEISTIKPVECPYYLVSRVNLVVAAALKRELAEAGVEQVKPAYLGVLMCLWREDGLKGIELGSRAGLEPSTMTGLIDRMERDGLVVRKSSPSDRRVQLIYLTAQGKRVRKPVEVLLDRALPKVFKGITKRDLAFTKDVLRQILENADSHKS